MKYAEVIESFFRSFSVDVSNYKLDRDDAIIEGQLHIINPFI
jgi:hypothetical protein